MHDSVYDDNVAFNTIQQRKRIATHQATSDAKRNLCPGIRERLNQTNRRFNFASKINAQSRLGFVIIFNRGAKLVSSPRMKYARHTRAWS